MKYLIFNTRSDADIKNQQIATSQGAGTTAGDVTRFWFNTIDNLQTQQAALQVYDESVLSQQDIQDLKDEQYMIDNGWDLYL